MVYSLNYIKSREFLISLVLIPLFLFINFISGEYELIFAIISGILVLILLILSVYSSMKIKNEDIKSKTKSFFRFFTSNILMLLVVFIIELLLLKNCNGGLCGLSEAETMILFVPIQILILVVYGLSLMFTGFFSKDKFKKTN